MGRVILIDEEPLMSPALGVFDAPLRVGVLGAGAIGAVHVDAICATDGIELAAVSGGAGDLPKGVQRLSAEQLLDLDLDVVAICTPNATHALWALHAIETGRHVVVEKPLASTAAAARDVLRLAEANGVRVFGVAQRRLEPLSVQLGSMLAQDQLGIPRMAETRVHWWRDDAYFDGARWRREAASGGSLPNQGLHTLDLLLYWLGRPSLVTAQQATLGHAGLEVEDCLVATIRFDGGALATVATSTATPPGLPATLAVFTDRGSFEVRHETLAQWNFPIERPVTAEAASAGTGANDPAAIGSMGHRRLWTEVRDALKGARPSSVDGSEALQTVAVIEAIQRAAKSGRSVVVGELEETS